MQAHDDVPEFADWQAAIGAFLARFASEERAGWRCQPSPPSALAPWDDPRHPDGRTLLNAGGGHRDRDGRSSMLAFSVVIDWAESRVILDEYDEKTGPALDDGETIPVDAAWLRAFKRLPWPVDHPRHYRVDLGMYAREVLGYP